jgi:orotidine-5'-phosphate decarboxylase
VARRAATWGPGGNVGLVVGATAAEELRAVRDVAPGLAFLVPGVGAQGGDIAAVLAEGPARSGGASAGAGRGLLVNVSRGIAGAALRATDPGTLSVEARLAGAARDWAARLPVLP